jgi:hypothetical protein
MSKIPTKDDYLKQLRSNEAYQAILKKAPDQEMRKRIISQVEYFASSMFDGIMPVLSSLKADPAAAEKISEALKSGTGIIKESDGAPIVSGSKG